jgi:tRNA(fMet)-specific endonuclease VapC
VKRILLDTNAYVAYRRGSEDVMELLARADRTYVSAFVVAELLCGFRGGRRAAQNRRELEMFVGKPSVEFLPATWETAERFAIIRDALRRKGRPIPLNDVWIAAHCLETGAGLVSFDRHFTDVEGLLLCPMGD